MEIFLVAVVAALFVPSLVAVVRIARSDASARRKALQLLLLLALPVLGAILYNAAWNAVHRPSPGGKGWPKETSIDPYLLGS